MNFNDIASYKVIKLSPLDNASRTINAKTSELLRLERSIHRSMTDQTKSRGLFLDLSRELAGTVDSPINGVWDNIDYSWNTLVKAIITKLVKLKHYRMHLMN